MDFSRRKWEQETEKEAFLAAVEVPDSDKNALGKWVFPLTTFLGISSYAIAGTQVSSTQD
jgi:hypothetical protein